MINTTPYQLQTSAELDPLLLRPNEYRRLQSDSVGDLDNLDDEEVDEEDDDDDDDDEDKEDDTAGDEGIDDGYSE